MIFAENHPKRFKKDYIKEEPRNGSFGNVYKAFHTQAPQFYMAVKEVHPSSGHLSSSENSHSNSYNSLDEDLRLGKEMLQACQEPFHLELLGSHPNIVQYERSWIEMKKKVTTNHKQLIQLAETLTSARLDAEFLKPFAISKYFFHRFIQ